LPFKKLGAVYLPFDLSIAPMLFYHGDRCFIVALDPGNEALEFRDMELRFLQAKTSRRRNPGS
jgi:hypothetical protein